MEKTETLRRTLLSQFYRKNRFALSVAVFSALLLFRAKDSTVAVAACNNAISAVKYGKLPV